MKKEDVEQKIKDEGLAFIKSNRGLALDPKNPRSKGYISPRISSEFMDCSMPMTFDSYSHCSLGCTYCFAYMFKSNNISFNAMLHSVNDDRLIEAIKGKPTLQRGKSLYKHFFKKRFLLHWGGLADPFCNFEKTNKIGYNIIEALGEEAYPTLLSFKGSAIFRKNYRKLFEKYADQQNFAFQISIIAPSDEMSRKLEIGVPVTSRRIEAIKMLSDMGYYTILRLRPFIIGITDDGLEELLDRCLEAGIKAISTEFFALDIRSNEKLLTRYKYIGDLIGTDDILHYFKTLSPKERGGYMRLNRLVKEPHIKLMYKWCVENDIIFGCSDPDYKELNMSGSCCGMPDDFPENEELENWTKGQLTYALKEARKEWHKSGRRVRLRFTDVFKPDEDTYLKSVILGQDHPCVSDMTASERHGATYFRYARNIWNNLRTPSNPRNYFHGKVMPFRPEGNGDMMYLYQPSDYEERWRKEGIDLTK